MDDYNANQSRGRGRLGERVLWYLLLFLFVSITAVSAVAAYRYPDLHQILAIYGTFGAGGLSILIVIRLVFRNSFLWPTVGFAVAAAVLLLLFYGEEDWRGRSAWQAFQRKWAEQGVDLTWKSVIPPPVPDEDNFAMAPIVASSYLEYLDGKGGQKKVADTNFVNTRLNFDVHDATNEEELSTGMWTLSRKLNLAAWQNYFRSKDWAVRNLPHSLRRQTAAQDVLAGLSPYHDMIEELRQAAKRPESRFPLSYNQENPWEIDLPHLAKLRSCSRLLELRAVAELQDNRSEAALDDAVLIARLMETIHEEPFWPSHVYRCRILMAFLQVLWEGLDDHHWSDDQLMVLDNQLAGLNFADAYRLVLRGDIACQRKILNFDREHPVIMVNQGLEIGETNLPDPIELILQTQLLPSGWCDQYQLRAGENELMYLKAASGAEASFSPAAIAEADKTWEATTSDLKLFKFFIKYVNLPKEFSALARRMAFAQSSVNLARVAMALERYRLAHQVYPANLEALAPKFLDSVPHDVIDGGPLHYRLNPDGQFTLYSVGWNEKDDGGARLITTHSNAWLQNEDQTPQFDYENSDWVWSYEAVAN